MNAAALPLAIGDTPSDRDRELLLAFLGLLALGLALMGSASFGIAEQHTGDPFHYLIRQGGYAGVGLLAAFAAAQIPSRHIECAGPWLLFAALALLTLVLIPGVGRTVNGATRWIPLGAVNVQAAELVKLCVIVYLGGYLVRHGATVRARATGSFKPMLFVALVGLLLLAQPDFGAVAVLLVTVLGMMFLGGARLWPFGLLLAVSAAALALSAITEPYRLERLTGFMDPWADPYGSGFQLIQALIAIGRGEWFGAGLGASVQKLFYLPEAHTDFLYAVLAEELGLAGTLAVLGLYGWLTARIFAVARRAETLERPFNAFLCWGVGLWLAFQAFVHIGVNLGLLPTKGLTLPLMSYGGSSMVATCLALGLVFRVDYENRRAVIPERADPKTAAGERP